MRKRILAMFLACVIGMMSMTMVGCSTTWLTTFDRYVSQITPAVDAVIAILGLFGVGVPAGAGPTVGADVSALTTLVNDFANAAASAQPGIQTQITAAEAVLNQDLQKIFLVAHVSDPTSQAKVTELISLIESLVQAAENALPPSTTPAAVAAKAVPITKAEMIAQSFAKTFNVQLVKKTGNKPLDTLTPTLRLPQHGTLVHILTFNRVR